MEYQDSVDGFYEFQPLKDFESNFNGFVSRRAFIEEVENIWLDKDMITEDPDNIDFTFDDAENTLFNKEYQVKIGCDIYEMRENGMINLSNPEETDNTENSSNYLTESENCFSNRKQKTPINIDNNTQVNLKIAINSFLVRSSAKSKVVYYKKVRNKWKRRRGEMAVYLSGNVYYANCSNSVALGLRKPTNGYRKSRQVKEITRWWGIDPKPRKTKHLQLMAAFELSNNAYGNLFITHP